MHKGKKRGRKKIEVDLEEARHCRSISEAARLFGVSRRTIVRRMREEGVYRSR